MPAATRSLPITSRPSPTSSWPAASSTPEPVLLILSILSKDVLDRINRIWRRRGELAFEGRQDVLGQELDLPHHEGVGGGGAADAEDDVVGAEPLGVLADGRHHGIRPADDEAVIGQSPQVPALR